MSAASPHEFLGGERDGRWREALAAAAPRLERYRALLEAANRASNLVGASTMSAFATRHALDSAQLLGVAPEARAWADIGSGGGLPGMVLAILLRDVPDAAVHLIESVGKKCRFLRQAAAELDVPAIIHEARAETLSLDVEVVTARACAPLDRLLGVARPLLSGRAVGLFLKGRSSEAEIAAARRIWRFDHRLFASWSAPEGRIVEIRNLRRAR